MKKSLLPNLLSKNKAGAPQLPGAAEQRETLQLPKASSPVEDYHRSKLIKMLKIKSLAGKSVLEVGCGIGDVLLEISKAKPKELFGVDASEWAIMNAKQLLQGVPVDLSVVDGLRLPFPEKSFDTVLVMYELQHFGDKRDLEKVIYEVSRVSRQWVVLVEHTAQKEVATEHYIARPVEFYKEAFRKPNFHLRKIEYLHMNATRTANRWIAQPGQTLRWAFGPLLYLMGFPRSMLHKPSDPKPGRTLSKFDRFMQQVALFFTIGFDGVFRASGGTTVMWLERDQLFRRGRVTSESRVRK